MMKTILLGTALMIGSVAYAQADPRDAGQPIGSGNELQPGTTMGERDTHGTNLPPQPPYNSGAATTSTDTTAGSTMTTQGSMGATGTTMGTTGTTMGATGATMGTTGSGTVAVVQGGNMTPPPEPRASYPRCSRTITDNCVQDERRARDTRRTRR
jgi:hypothetical protein